MSAIPRTIVAFARDPHDEAWIARLDCHHRRHVRHRPPLANYPWVTTAAGRDTKLGQSIECAACFRRELPADVKPYKTTATFTDRTVPAGLVRDHATKRGVWARLIVGEGRVLLTFAAPLSLAVDVQPGDPAAIPPEVRHHVRLCQGASFRVEFLR